MSNESFGVLEKPSGEAICGYYEGMRAFWHPVMRAADLVEGRLAGIELLGESIVVARLNGAIAAMQDLCRHFQANGR